MNMDDLMKDIEGWVEQVAVFQRNAIQCNHIQVTTKAHDTDFVTDVDVKSEEILIQCIHEKYPHHSILTEERGFLDRNSDYLWVIDPIDGTTNFIHGFPMSSISIALQHKGITQAGMVYCPWLNMKFHAIRSGGAYYNGKRMQVSGTSELKHSLLTTGFPSKQGEQPINLEYFNKMIGKVSGIRRTGSAALDLCFVAASFFDGYWEFDLNDWDICAGVLIAEEAGGKVLRMDIHHHSLLICSNPHMLDALKAALVEKEGI
ncbi:inositol monophosphatase family protein [Paenibacillus sp. KN14-4R]|uniref:inositol monophosphatase family protein n=1 Tax=Paenibacillus sp. KN14-4R TaxID=3445773 RepID=UPI003FA1542A